MTTLRLALVESLTDFLLQQPGVGRRLRRLQSPEQLQQLRLPPVLARGRPVVAEGVLRFREELEAAARQRDQRSPGGRVTQPLGKPAIALHPGGLIVLRERLAEIERFSKVPIGAVGQRRAVVAGLKRRFEREDAKILHRSGALPAIAQRAGGLLRLARPRCPPTLP